MTRSDKHHRTHTAEDGAGQEARPSTPDCCGFSLDRRGLIKVGLGVAGGAALGAGSAMAQNDPYAPPEEGALPQTDVELERGRTALLVVDPLVDFLDPSGAAWDVVKDNVEQLGTVHNIERVLEAAKSADMPVLISPHYYYYYYYYYYYPYDHEWEFGGPLEKMMHNIGMFDLDSRYADVEGTGADFLERYKPYILDGKSIICLPHKVYGPQNNDVVLQLRKRRIDKVVLAGMSANLCVESHLRHLLEQGFEVAVIKDATAAAQLPEGDGYLAALINFRFIANGLWGTDETVERISELAG